MTQPQESMTLEDAVKKQDAFSELLNAQQTIYRSYVKGLESATMQWFSFLGYMPHDQLSVRATDVSQLRLTHAPDVIYQQSMMLAANNSKYGSILESKSTLLYPNFPRR